MNALFQKITIFVLIAACLVLVVDKTRQSMELNGVAARIAEKTSTIEKERADFKSVCEKLQNEIRMRDETCRLIPPGRKTEKDEHLPQPADLKDSSIQRLAAELAPEAESPARLSRAFRKLAKEKQLLPDVFRIDPDSGLVVSRAASLLTMTARSAGMDVRPSLIWDMRTFRPYVTLDILPPDLPDRKIVASPVTMNLTESGKAPTDGHRDSLRQDRVESVVFPFEAKWQGRDANELTLLPVGSVIPCGGLYLNFFSSADHSDWFLEYEFPEDADPKEVNLQVVPLDVNMKVTSQITERVQSFLIKPGSNQYSALLIGADKAFFPVRITATRVEPKITLKTLKSDPAVEP